MRRSSAPSTRDRMLDATESLLRERGVAGASIKQIVARSRMPRARQTGQPFITAGEWLAAAAGSHAKESS